MEAEKLEVQVIETRKTVLRPEHPSTLLSMPNLSHTLKGLGRHAEALSLLQACLQLQERRLGPAHPNTIAATANLKAWQNLSSILPGCTCWSECQDAHAQVQSAVFPPLALPAIVPDYGK